MEFDEKIIKLLSEHAMTAQELADKLGIKESQVRRELGLLASRTDDAIGQWRLPTEKETIYFVDMSAAATEVEKRLLEKLEKLNYVDTIPAIFGTPVSSTTSYNFNSMIEFLQAYSPMWNPLRFYKAVASAYESGALDKLLTPIEKNLIEESKIAPISTEEIKQFKATRLIRSNLLTKIGPKLDLYSYSYCNFLDNLLSKAGVPIDGLFSYDKTKFTQTQLKELQRLNIVDRNSELTPLGKNVIGYLGACSCRLTDCKSRRDAYNRLSEHWEKQLEDVLDIEIAKIVTTKGLSTAKKMFMTDFKMRDGKYEACAPQTYAEDAGYLKHKIENSLKFAETVQDLEKIVNLLKEPMEASAEIKTVMQDVKNAIYALNMKNNLEKLTDEVSGLLEDPSKTSEETFSEIKYKMQDLQGAAHYMNNAETVESVISVYLDLLERSWSSREDKKQKLKRTLDYLAEQDCDFEKITSTFATAGAQLVAANLYLERFKNLSYIEKQTPRGQDLRIDAVRLLSTCISNPIIGRKYSHIVYEFKKEQERQKSADSKYELQQKHIRDMPDA